MARKSNQAAVVETAVVEDTTVVAEALATVATISSSDTVYALTEKGAATLGRTGLQTLQRGTLGLGMAWRNGAVKGGSLRASALATLFADLEDGNDAIVARSAALAKLATIPLGTKSPVTRLSAFLRAGLLAEIA